MTGIFIGYARVSTTDQDLTAQTNALTALGVAHDHFVTQKILSTN